MGIEFSGLDGILDNIAASEIAIKRAVRRGVQKGGKVIQAQCKAMCPVDTGELHDSIIEQTSGDGEGEYTSEVGPTAPHGIHVELGTGLYAKNGAGRQTPWRYQDAKGQWHTASGQPPQPYMEPGFEAGKGEAVEVLREEVRNAIN